VGVDARPWLPAFGAYLDLLTTWNQRISLTAIRDAEGIVARHFVDSLAVVPAIPAKARTLVDVGSGPGFPGAVVAIARPDLDVLLVESNHKKVAFLEAVRRELKLGKLKTSAERVEKLPERPGFAGSFDVATSRATLDLPEWLKVGARLVRDGGTVIGMEGADRHELPAGAERRMYSVGGVEMALVVWTPSVPGR